MADPFGETSEEYEEDPLPLANSDFTVDPELLEPVGVAEIYEELAVPVPELQDMELSAQEQKPEAVELVKDAPENTMEGAGSHPETAAD